MIGTETSASAGLPTTRRRVRRILRKFDPWTVFKVSAVLSALAGLGLVLLSVMVWAVINRLGLATALDAAAERVALIGPEESLFKTGGEYLRGMVLLAGSWILAATASITVGSIVYNLLADLVGGVEFIVLEEVPLVPGGGGALTNGAGRGGA